MTTYWRVEICVASLRSRDYDKKNDIWRLSLMPKDVPSGKPHIFKSTEESRRGQTCNVSCEQRKGGERQTTCQQHLRKRRLHSLDYDRPMLLWRFVRVQACIPTSVNSTPHRVHFAHAIFSRVWLKIEPQSQCEAIALPFKNFFCVNLAHHVSFALVMV